MKKIANLNEKERAELFNGTAEIKRITPAAAEKDFWLCWVLMILSENADLSKLLKLKGGTSLSKCFSLIDRFSEDIDLILDWRELTKENPIEKRSKNQQKIFNNKVREQANNYIENRLLPILDEAIQPICHGNIDEYDSGTINIVYPKAFSDEYLRPEIKLEIGTLSSMVPCDTYRIMSYSAEAFPSLFDQPEIEVVAITAERTFWEKVTILHSEAHRPQSSPLPPRYSRHYYDVFKMIGTVYETNALADLELLKNVVLFKELFYPRGWANYDLAVPKTMKLIPNESWIDSLKADYESMEEMIFGDYPGFDEILDKLKSFESKLNNL